MQDSGIWAFPVQTTGTSNTSNPSGKMISAGAGQANTSFFGDMAFDASGNLWVADYNNNSVLAFPSATLGTTNTFAIVAGGAGPFPVVSTLGTPPASPSLVFASPEGVAFDGAGNLWVGNNNDGANAIGQQTTLTTLVQITPALQQTILGQAAAGGKTVTLAASAAFTTLAQVKTAAPPSGFAIYALPTPGGVVPQFGGVQIDTIGNTDLTAGKPQYLYVNDEVYQTVRQFDINPFSPGFVAGIGAAAAMNATALNLVDAEGKPVVSNPGNGGIALVRANLLIGDAPSGAGADTGVEPDTAIALNDGGVFWESNNLGVYVESSGAPPALTPPFDNTVDIPLPAGKDVYVYVNVQNFGCTATTGTERLRVYWASGATAQAWPESWTEITTPATSATLGGLAAGASRVVPILWPSGNYPSDPGDPGNTHYCLLARIETAPVDPFGMTYWEQKQVSGPVVSNMYYNVASNAGIAQRNIFFGSAMHRREGSRDIAPVPIVIKVGNLGTTRSSIRLGFQLFGPTGAPVGFDGGRLVIHAKGHESLCERLLELAIEIIDHLGDGLFHIKDPVRGLTYFSLAPKEMLPIHLVFTPPPGLTDLALRAIQYNIVEGTSHLVGGQTFVFGTVCGVSTRNGGARVARPARQGRPVRCPNRLHSW